MRHIVEDFLAVFNANTRIWLFYVQQRFKGSHFVEDDLHVRGVWRVQTVVPLQKLDNSESLKDRDFWQYIKGLLLISGYQYQGFFCEVREIFIFEHLTKCLHDPMSL